MYMYNWGYYPSDEKKHNVYLGNYCVQSGYNYDYTTDEYTYYSNQAELEGT